MMRFRLTIRARLMLLGAVALGGVLVSSVFGIFQLAAFNAEQIRSLGDIRDSNALTSEVRAAEAELKNQGREWKNLLLRGSDAASFEGHKKAFFEAEKRTLEVIGHAAEIMKKANHPRLGVLEEATRMHGDLGKLYNEVIAKWDANDPDNARKGDDALKGKDRPLAEALGKLVGDISQEQKEGIERQISNSEAFYQSARNIFFGVLAVSAVVVLLLVSLTVTTISRQVATLSGTLECIRRDLDLSSRLPAAGSDEISLTAQNVNALLDEFQSTVRQMKGGAGQVAQASQQLSKSVGQLSGAVAQQHDATSSMAASIEELAASVGQVANSSAIAQNISVDSRDHAIRGGEVIDKTTGIMAQMADSVRSTAETIADLQRHSQEIDSIAGTIKEIADQTNLLALNAAIEAARAGESGRGFAVVADEVRKLAERTTKATAEIAKVIETIQTNTLKAVGDMESVVVQARDNAALVSQAGEAIVAIRRGSGEVVEVTNGIATAIKEQSSASNLLAQQIERVANMSETNSATLSQVKEASIEMNQLSDEMRRMAERFRV